MADVTPVVVAVGLETEGTGEADRQRTLEGLEAAVRFAVRRGTLARVEMMGEGAGGGPDLPVLTLPPGSYPAPSMLAALLDALPGDGAGAVEARRIPWGGTDPGCRLTRPPAAGTGTPAPAAVVFCDHRPDTALPLAGAAAGETSPFLSVVMRTQGLRRATLEEALTCLAAQTVDDFEVLLAVHSDEPDALAGVHDLVAGFTDGFRKRIDVQPVTGGGRVHPLNAGLDRAGGRYVAFLDDDDVVTGDWVATFLAGSVAAPGAVVRASSVNQRIERADPSTGAPYREIGTPEPVFAARFDLLEHLRDNSTPIFSFAVPRAVVGDERFCEDLPVLEDWDFFMRMALAAGVHDTGRVTGVYHWWVSGESTLDQTGSEAWREARRQVLARLDSACLRLPPGSAVRLAALMDELAAGHEELEVARRHAADADRELDAMRRSRSWRAATLLRRLSTGVRRRPHP
jgi:hypothetical protein